MAKTRSPNYPVVSLDKAVELVRKVYKADYKNKVDKAVVATHLGYGGINGKSLGVISALSKFGLLDGRGDLLVTDDAVTILVDPKESPARQQAIRRAALLPAMFAQLHTHFGGTVPSPENLSAYLQKNGFTPPAAQIVAKTYRDTMLFVTQEAGDTPAVEQDDESAEGKGMQGQQDTGAAGRETSLKPPPVGSVREVSMLDEGEAVLQWPATLSATSVEELEDWLQLVLKKLKRRYGKG